MTESEYIIVWDLARVRSAMSVIRETDTADEGTELRGCQVAVHQSLYRWQELLHEALPEIEEDPGG